MCWIGTNDKELTPKVAEDNIPVEKIVKIGTNIYNEECYYAAYYDKVYELNTTYKTNNMFLHGCEVEEGFHSYKGVKIVIVKELEAIYIYSKNNVKLDSWSIHDIAIMSCVIPKGSTYYENRHGEIVSDTIRPIHCYKIKYYET